MKIVNLMENTTGSHGCLSEHGLSFYIETPKHRLLMDTGASDAFLANARMLGIDLTQVDTVILSHGHYDHSGGILPFVQNNPSAKIYMQKTAGDDYYHCKEASARYIGIDKAILKLPQLILVEGDYRIDDELFLFANITGNKYRARTNLSLMRRACDWESPSEPPVLEQDTFDHEQCLVISACGKHFLFSGCAHNGILNILDRYHELYQSDPDLVLSGFHMAQKTAYSEDDLRIIRSTAKALMQTGSIFYTGHCTGIPAFETMKEIMKERLIYFHSGDIIL